MPLQTILAILTLLAVCVVAVAGLTFGGLAALYVALACLPAYGLAFGIEFRNITMRRDSEAEDYR